MAPAARRTPGGAGPRPTSVDDVVACARRRLYRTLGVLPFGVLTAWGVVIVTTAPGGLRQALLIAGAAGQSLVVLPKVLRSYRLWRARWVARHAVGHEVAVQVAVFPTGTFLAVVVAVWEDAHQPAPSQVYAADMSATGLVEAGRVWATVPSGAHRLAIYRLEDGTPVIAAGRTNVLQRLQVRYAVVDRQRTGPHALDRPADAPYPRLARPRPWHVDAVRTVGHMALVAAAVGGPGLVEAFFSPFGG